ncbi:MAG TPA: lipocalin family protein, partial [Syntrophorhabdaceae bacterium]|nr:lipocalin family protein [Syntrophorhabdaceae bacterium]
RGLSRVTAEYSLRPDGGVRVVNRGYSADEQKWKEAIGKAYPVGDPDVAHLRVSFFGPFYSSYIVFELDKEYRYALVCGRDRSYLWILAREPKMDRETIDMLVAKAGEAGFDSGALIFVDQQQP